MRGCGSPRNQPARDKKFAWADPYHDKQFEHKATLVWLAGPELELEELREQAETFESKLRRDFPQLKIIVASPPPGRRLTAAPLHWFELGTTPETRVRVRTTRHTRV